MTPARTVMEGAVQRVRLAPGWTVSTYRHTFEGEYVCFTATLADSRKPGGQTTVQIRSAVPPLPHAQAAFEWLLWRWLIICCHEGREFFTVDGAVWSDPHED